MSGQPPPPPLPGPLRIADRAVALLARGLALLGGVFLTLMMLQTVADVVSRLAVNAPIRGNLEVISYYYMTGVVFLPLALTERRFEHIGVDLVTRLLPVRARSRLYALTILLAAGFFALLAYQTFLDAVASTERGEILMGGAIVAIWPPKWFLPMGFAAACLACLANMARALWAPAAFDPSPALPAVD